MYCSTYVLVQLQKHSLDNYLQNRLKIASSFGRFINPDNCNLLKEVNVQSYAQDTKPEEGVDTVLA
jgi:hypothetical protein